MRSLYNSSRDYDGRSRTLSAELPGQGAWISSLDIAELWRPQNAQIVAVLRYHWDGHVRKRGGIMKEPSLREYFASTPA